MTEPTTSLLEGLCADRDRALSREERDAWSLGYVYGLNHAIQAIQNADPSPSVAAPATEPNSDPAWSGCSSKDLPSVCIRCGTVIWTGGIHLNGHTECDMWEVPGV